MISYEWRAELSGDDLEEVTALVTAAAEYDAEAGFSSIGSDEVADNGGGSFEVLHLPIRAKRDLSARDDAPMVIVAYLRLAVDSSGLGVAKYVVHPDYRSRGVTTQFAEEVGLDAGGPGGWFGSRATALRCWAYATHPAADRFAKRFDVPAVRRQWTEVRHLTGPFAPRIAPTPLADGFTASGPLGAGDDRAAITRILDAASVPELYRDGVERDLGREGAEAIVVSDRSGDPVAFVSYSTEVYRYDELRASSIHSLVVSDVARGHGVGRALLSAAFAEQEKAGAQLSLMRIDPDDERAVTMVRLLGFEQAESHSCYQVGRSDAPVPEFDLG